MARDGSQGDGGTKGRRQHRRTVAGESVKRPPGAPLDADPRPAEDSDEPQAPLGQGRGVSHRELKLTAALYAARPDILAQVKATGELPSGRGAAAYGARGLIERRGTDIELTPDEQLVLDAILRAGRLPFGCVFLVDE